MGVLAAWQATKLEATKNTEPFLDDEHPLQKSFDILFNEFSTSDEDQRVKVYFAWGLGEINRDGVNLLFDNEDVGEPTFLETFTFNQECQSALVNACTQLTTNATYAPYIKQDAGIASTFCFVEELAVYSLKGESDCDLLKSREWLKEDWEVSAEDLPTVMEGFLEQQSCLDQSKTIQSVYGNEIGWDGNNMKYAAMAAESLHLDPFSRPAFSFTKNVYDGFLGISQDLNAIVSEPCGGTVVMTDLDQKFTFMNTQQIYVRTAVQSATLGIIIAFVVLMFATRVFHIALLATLSIASVLVSIVGMMVLLGWDLSSLESILIAVTAGFSVDYVVHLAHAYESAKGSTEERVKSAFSDMGISVLNGMITSIAASIPLFFCQLTFFAKFGTFLCLTIAFSWTFANFVFMSALVQLNLPVRRGRWGVGC